MLMTDRSIASIIHEANRQHRIVLGESPGPHWNETDEDFKKVVVDGVAHVRNGVTTEELHQTWMEAKGAQGWTWGPYKDTVHLRHPCMVPYGDLPEAQRAKDQLFAAIAAVLLSTEEVTT
jgi:hypothetical protein